ncbi:MAG: hypothetical protein ABII71_00350 [Candidatus Micrarchaeota archaeon]
MAFTESFYLTWETIAITAAAFSVMGAVILIMVSRLLELRNLEQIAKAEFTFAASTVLIVLLAMGIFDVVEQALMPFAGFLYAYALGAPGAVIDLRLDDGTADGAPIETLLDYAKLFMATPMLCVEEFMYILYLLSIPVEAIASTFMEIFMSEHASGFGFKWLAERITNTTQMLTFYTYVYYIMYHMLDFIKYYAGFFFSVGVILRAFPLTRGGGAYVMAISMGLYFIFPLTYILISAVSMPHAMANMIVVDDVDSHTVDGFYVCALPQVPRYLEDLGCGSDSASSLLRMRSILDVNRDLISDLMTVHFSELTRHLVSAMCIFPMVAFVILLTFVLNTSNLFGGNIPEIGRGLVRLI